MWRPKVEAKSPPLLLSTPIFETGPLTEPRLTCFPRLVTQQALQGLPSSPLHSGNYIHTLPCPAFYQGSEGPRDRVFNAVPVSHLSSQDLGFVCLFVICLTNLENSTFEVSILGTP